MDEKRKELQSFTIDCIKELCSDKHIKVYGKTKDALVEQLLAAGGPEKAEVGTADKEKLTPTICGSEALSGGQKSPSSCC